MKIEIDIPIKINYRFDSDKKIVEVVKILITRKLREPRYYRELQEVIDKAQLEVIDGLKFIKK